MNVIILGSGRVGSTVALQLVDRGHSVTVIDRDVDSLMRLGGEDFAGMFFVGEGLDSELLLQAGIDRADAFIASTDDDNTNLVVAQVAQRRFNVRTVVVRAFDPDKAEFYSKRGLRVVCPTLKAISEMADAVERGMSDRRGSDGGDGGDGGDDAGVAGAITSHVTGQGA